MESNGLLVLKYQENFADNMTSLAYGKILENISNRKCYFENSTKERVTFENKMSDFRIDCDYISSTRVKEIARKAFNLNKVLIDEENIKKEIKNKKSSKNKIIDLKHFDINDISYISDDIKSMFYFKNEDFIVNYDIYEDIIQTNSIGLYINKKDFENEEIDYNFIQRAFNRLNKYVKQPKLFIFSSKNIQDKLKLDINYKVFAIHDWREEFLFLKSCKHKILCDLPNSYSEGFWASVLANKEYGITIYNTKTNKNKTERNNWIGV